jgi:1,4-dihydroxy-2-naphthoate octaprenyltransferase/chlorophyll synthase
MGRATLQSWERWAYALKPASWPKLGAPFLLGQALGYVAAGRFDVGAFVVGGAFTFAYVVYIVLLNDWGDREVDALKRRMFPTGCSPKTIPDGILPGSAVLAAGLGAGLVGLAVSAVGGVWLGRPALGSFGLAALLIFHAYTFGPLRLNYRGGGEILEMAGIGVAVPLLNAYAQSGAFWGPAHGLVVGHALLSLASALASGLADERSDRDGGKTTCTTLWGNRTVRALVDGLLPAGVFAWVLASAEMRHAMWTPVAAGSAVVLYFAARARRESPAAVTDAFDAQRRYKNELHRAIWYGPSVLAAGLALWEALA